MAARHGEDAIVNDGEGEITQALFDEMCLRHLVSRLPVAQAIWRADTSAALVNSFSVLYGSEDAKAVVRKVTDQLLVAVMNKVIDELEAFLDEGAELDVDDLAAALKNLEHVEVDANSLVVLFNAIVHCAFQSYLVCDDLETGFANAQKILKNCERPDESDLVAQQRVKANKLARDMYEEGSKNGIAAMRDMGNAQIKSDFPNATVLVQNLKQCAHAINERLGQLWNNLPLQPSASHLQPVNGLMLESHDFTLANEPLNATAGALAINGNGQRGAGRALSRRASAVPILPKVDAAGHPQNGMENAVHAPVGQFSELVMSPPEQEPPELPNKAVRVTKSTGKRTKAQNGEGSRTQTPPKKRARQPAGQNEQRNRGGFSKEEDQLLLSGLKEHGWSEWALISATFFNAAPYTRTAMQIKDRSRYLEQKGVLQRAQFPVVRRVVRSGPLGGTPKRPSKKKEEMNIPATEEKIEAFEATQTQEMQVETPIPIAPVGAVGILPATEQAVQAEQALPVPGGALELPKNDGNPNEAIVSEAAGKKIVIIAAPGLKANADDMVGDLQPPAPPPSEVEDSYSQKVDEAAAVIAATGQLPVAVTEPPKFVDIPTAVNGEVSPGLEEHANKRRKL